MIDTVRCQHNWQNDEMFENGVVEMTFNCSREMRQFCDVCGKVRYISLEENADK